MTYGWVQYEGKRVYRKLPEPKEDKSYGEGFPVIRVKDHESIAWQLPPAVTDKGDPNYGKSEEGAEAPHYDMRETLADGSPNPSYGCAAFKTEGEKRNFAAADAVVREKAGQPWSYHYKDSNAPSLIDTVPTK